MEQVLVSLLENGLRHTPPGGIIQIDGGASEEQVWLPKVI